MGDIKLLRVSIPFYILFSMEASILEVQLGEKVLPSYQVVILLIHNHIVDNIHHPIIKINFRNSHFCGGIIYKPLNNRMPP